MTLKTEITRKEYAKQMTVHLLKKPTMIIIFIMGISLIIFHIQNPGFGMFYLLLGLGLSGIPLLTYLTIGQAYDKNKHFNEKITFSIDEKGIEFIGQTFRSAFTWAQITKVKETNNFFSFHQGQVLMALINKEINDQESVSALRNLLKHKEKLR